MAITVTQIKTHVTEQAHKDLGATSGSADDNTVERWVLRAIRYMQRYDFECWRNEFSLTLSAETYNYPYASAIWTAAALTRPLRIDGSDGAVGYGTSQWLKWKPTIKEIDVALGGHSWKRIGSGTPTYFSQMGQSLILGCRPSSDFVASYPTLYGYYYRGEDLSSSGFEDNDLAMYDDFFEHVINLAMVFALQQTDDSEFRTQLQYWLQSDLVEMRGYDHVPSDDEPIPPPPFARLVDGVEDGLF